MASGTGLAYFNLSRLCWNLLSIGEAKEPWKCRSLSRAPRRFFALARDDSRPSGRARFKARL